MNSVDAFATAPVRRLVGIAAGEGLRVASRLAPKWNERDDRSEEPWGITYEDGCAMFHTTPAETALCPRLLAHEIGHWREGGESRTRHLRNYGLVGDKLALDGRERRALELEPEIR